jgi:hypothetical protein
MQFPAAMTLLGRSLSVPGVVRRGAALAAYHVALAVVTVAVLVACAARIAGR